MKTAKTFAHATRAHWGIENGLHRTLDVVFREDECRARTGHSARNLSILRKQALTLLRRGKGQDVQAGPATRRLHADRDESYREALIDQAFNKGEGLNL